MVKKIQEGKGVNSIFWIAALLLVAGVVASLFYSGVISLSPVDVTVDDGPVEDSVRVMEDDGVMVVGEEQVREDLRASDEESLVEIEVDTNSKYYVDINQDIDGAVGMIYPKEGETYEHAPEMVIKNIDVPHPFRYFVILIKNDEGEWVESKGSFRALPLYETEDASFVRFLPYELEGKTGTFELKIQYVEFIVNNEGHADRMVLEEEDVEITMESFEPPEVIATGGPGTFCGDNAVQTPNDQGEMEECDNGDSNGDGATEANQCSIIVSGPDADVLHEGYCDSCICKPKSDNYCSCKSMEIKIEGELEKGSPWEEWVPKQYGGVARLGPSNTIVPSALPAFNKRYRGFFYEVHAEIEGNPELCEEGQDVQSTVTRSSVTVDEEGNAHYNSFVTSDYDYNMRVYEDGKLVQEWSRTGGIWLNVEDSDERHSSEENLLNALEAYQAEAEEQGVEITFEQVSSPFGGEEYTSDNYRSPASNKVHDGTSITWVDGPGIGTSVYIDPKKGVIEREAKWRIFIRGKKATEGQDGTQMLEDYGDSCECELVLKQTLGENGEYFVSYDVSCSDGQSTSGSEDVPGPST